jgi:hypothetical protein
MFSIIIDETKIANAFKKVTANDTIDFGLLDESFQKTIMSHVLSDQANRDRLIRLNPFLSDSGDVSDKEKLIQNNMNAVLLNYNKSKYREKLVDIYSEVIEDNVYHKIDKKVLLSKFLTLEDFSLLKWCEYAEE